MSEADITTLLREFLWAAVVIAAPMLLAALVVGVFVGLFQALTSIQEMTLTFAPKVFVMLVVFWLSAGVMARQLVGLFNNRVIPLIAGG